MISIVWRRLLTPTLNSPIGTAARGHGGPSLCYGSCRLRLWEDGEASMSVTGIGGFFFRAKDPEAMRA